MLSKNNKRLHIERTNIYALKKKDHSNKVSNIVPESHTESMKRQLANYIKTRSLHLKWFSKILCIDSTYTL